MVPPPIEKDARRPFRKPEYKEPDAAEIAAQQDVWAHKWINVVQSIMQRGSPAGQDALPDIAHEPTPPPLQRQNSDPTAISLPSFAGSQTRFDEAQVPRTSSTAPSTPPKYDSRVKSLKSFEELNEQIASLQRFLEESPDDTPIRQAASSSSRLRSEGEAGNSNSMPVLESTPVKSVNTSRELGKLSVGQTPYQSKGNPSSKSKNYSTSGLSIVSSPLPPEAYVNKMPPLSPDFANTPQVSIENYGPKYGALPRMRSRRSISLTREEATPIRQLNRNVDTLPTTPEPLDEDLTYPDYTQSAENDASIRSSTETVSRYMRTKSDSVASSDSWESVGASEASPASQSQYTASPRKSRSANPRQLTPGKSPLGSRNLFPGDESVETLSRYRPVDHASPSGMINGDEDSLEELGAYFGLNINEEDYSPRLVEADIEGTSLGNESRAPRRRLDTHDQGIQSSSSKQRGSGPVTQKNSISLAHPLMVTQTVQTDETDLSFHEFDHEDPYREFVQVGTSTPLPMLYQVDPSQRHSSHAARLSTTSRLSQVFASSSTLHRMGTSSSISTVQRDDDDPNYISITLPKTPDQKKQQISFDSTEDLDASSSQVPVPRATAPPPPPQPPMMSSPPPVCIAYLFYVNTCTYNRFSLFLLPSRLFPADLRHP